MKKALIVTMCVFLTFTLLVSCTQTGESEIIPASASVEPEKPPTDAATATVAPTKTPTPKSNEDILKEYLTSTLIPEYKITQVDSKHNPTPQKLEGLLSYCIKDFDKDNLAELLTVSLKKLDIADNSDDYSLATEKYSLSYNLYGVENENAVLLSSHTLPTEHTLGFYYDDAMQGIIGEYAIDIVLTDHAGKTYLASADYYGYGYETSSQMYTIYEFENKGIAQKYRYENNATIDYEDYQILKNGEPIFDGLMDNEEGYTILANELSAFGINDTVFFGDNPEGVNSDTVTHIARIWNNAGKGDAGWKVIDYTNINSMSADAPQDDQQNEGESQSTITVDANSGTITVSGTLEQITEMMETRDGEAEVTFYALKLNLPTEFVFEEFLSDEDSEFGEGIMRDITEIHVGFNMPAKEIEQYLGKNVTIHGKAFQAHTQNHFRPIVMIDCVVQG